MNRPRILIVDDEPQIQRFLRPALLASDYDVISAATGREARREAANRAPDLVVLDLGADDYVEKPFGIAELLARIRTALRRQADRSAAAPVVLAFGDLSIDSGRRIVTRDGERVHLTPKEYDLLLQLARNAGRVMTHRHLLTAVWGPAHADDVQYLRVVVAQLRAKIEPDPRHPGLIVNEPAVGYRFAAEP